MRSPYQPVLLGSLVLLAVTIPARAQTAACFTITGSSLYADFVLYNSSNIFEGTGFGLTTYQFSGGRGTNSRTIRHHYFDFMNPAAGNDPGCSDGTGIVDWLVYNTRITGSSGGGAYSWSGRWRNSCGTTGTATGMVTLGACTAPRPDVPVNDEAQRVTPVAARTEAPVADVDSPLVTASPEGGITYCYTNALGYQHEGVLDPASGILYGPGDSGSERLVHGGRGLSGEETRHHTFVWQNPNADDDPGCGDASGSTDWFTYNGLVGGGSGGTYTYNAAVLSSCGFTGTRPGTITLGPCPAPRHAPTPGPEAVVPKAAEVGAEAASAGVAVVSGPNPFSTSTTIIFALAETAHVRLVVYDLLGREVTVLVDEERAAGSHAAVFDGSTLPAGTYLYRLEAGTFTETKPMMLVR